MSQHRVTHGAGAQVIALVPPARPAAATFSITDARYSETNSAFFVVPLGTAATVDAVSTTTTASAGRGADRNLILLGAVTDIVVGRRYWIESSKGHREIVTVDAINATAKTVRSRHPLQHEYSAGAAFRGAEVRATVPSAWTDNDDVLKQGMPAIVTWVLDGGVHVREVIMLERAKTQLATVQDVLELNPSLSNIANASGRTDLPTALAQAHAHYNSLLAVAGIDPRTHNGGHIARELVKYLAGMFALQNSSSETDTRNFEFYQKQVEVLRQALVIGQDKPGVVEQDLVHEAISPAKRIRSLWRLGM